MRNEVLAEQAWNFIVFKHGDDWVLNYVAGGVGLYEVSIRLNEEEVTRIRATPEYAKSLAEQFRLAPESFRARELRPALSLFRQ
jgi:hypothetical protein